MILLMFGGLLAESKGRIFFDRVLCVKVINGN